MFRALLTIAVLLIAPYQAAWALSCVEPDGEQIIKESDLIAKARITHIEEPLKILNNNQPHKIITFKIGQVYKGDKALVGQEIKAEFSSFMGTWGPQLSKGEEGEYIFDSNEKTGKWSYAGPGACTYLEEELWIKLRKQAQAPAKN